jgi:tripartite-type tricarboxylate transporter receptor subunit TctC
VTDITARLIGPRLSDRLGRQFVVENRPGASANLAAGSVVRAPPDGYTCSLSRRTTRRKFVGHYAARNDTLSVS